jgi:hypothetical protein
MFLGGSFIDRRFSIFVLFVLNSINPFWYFEKSPATSRENPVRSSKARGQLG